MHIHQKQKIDKYLGFTLIGVLWPFTRLLGIVLRRNHSTKNIPSEILFIKLMGLGSLVLSIDALTTIKKKYPNTKLILLADSNLSAGIKPFFKFDEVWDIDLNNLVYSSSKIFQFVIKSIKYKKLWVVDLEVYSKLTTVFSLLTFAINRFGFFLPSVSFRKYLNTHNIPFNQSSFLEDNYNVMACTITGIEKVEPAKSKQKKKREKKNYVIFNNTCSDLSKERKLPEKIFSEIASWIVTNTSYKIAFLGTKRDGADIDYFINNDTILSKCKERILNLAGKTEDFTEYYQFLENEGVCVITIDSGPLHFAKKLGVPTLSLWGPTNPRHYLKIQPDEQEIHTSYYLQTECSPCVHRFEKPPCGGDNICMKQMDSIIIIEKIKKLLEKI